MEFTYSGFKHNEFLNTMGELVDELKISSFGMIEFTPHPKDDNMEIASVQDSFVARLSPEQLAKLTAIK